MFGGVVQDVGGFGHFHHEGGSAAGDVVRGAHAGENAVDGADDCPVGGHKAAGVGQQGNQRCLAHVSGFTAHVRAGDHQHAALGIHQQIIGYERLIQQLFDHRVATFLNVKTGGFAEFRRRESQGGGALGKITQYIQFRQCLGGVLQGCQLLSHGFEDFIVEAFLTGQRPALGTQGLVFKFLEFRCNKPLGIFQGLAANIVHRRLVRLGPAYFDVIPVYPVVADLQGADASAVPLPSFHIQQVLAGVLADVAQLVQLFVKALPDDPTIANHDRRVVDDGAFQKVRQFRVFTNGGRQLDDVMGVDRFQCFLQVRQGLEGIPESCEVPRSRRAQGNSRQYPLNVAHGFQQVVYRFVMKPVQQCRNRLLALTDSLHVPQRAVQPAAKLPAAHGRGCAVHHPGQGVLMSAHQVSVDFQVATAGGIQNHSFIPAFAGQLADMGQGGSLGLPGILQQTTGGTDGQIEVLTAKTGQISHLQLLGNHPAGRVGFEQPRALTADTGEALQYFLVGKILADQNFRRTQALEFALQGFQVLQL